MKRFAAATLVPRVADPALASAQQHALCVRWGVPHEALDPESTDRFLNNIAAFAVGRSGLPTAFFPVLQEVAASACPPMECAVHSLRGAWELLERAGHVAARDNLHRVAAHRIDLPPEADMFAQDHVTVSQDPFDGLREELAVPAYAIDSATTSEVDDAIALEPCPHGGPPLFTVVVADATVHCPFDSELERHSARLLTTTTYLPETVRFMLPRPVVEAATLQEAHRCRTFVVRFRIDPETGALGDMSVGVGWCGTLRRITYDAVQDMLDAPGSVPPSAPAWLGATARDDIATIARFAEVRARERRARSRAVSGNLPDPLVVVEGCRVVAVQDQVVCTKDARLAVAELMIAANEACSRVAQQNRVQIPFRGSRPLSTLHEAASLRRSAPGQRGAQPGSELQGFAGAVHESLEQLRGVTRAIYHPTPLRHTGLDTVDYCHSTSPLRRFPDMLVHHQLKAMISRTAGRPLLAYVPEAQLASLCEHSSSQQARGKMLQQASARFWILSFLRDAVRAADASVLAPDGTVRCVVGVSDDQSGTPCSRRPLPVRSGVYIPALQMVHAVRHSDPGVEVGDVLHCRVARVVPEEGALDLVVVRREQQPGGRALGDVVTLPSDT